MTVKYKKPSNSIIDTKSVYVSLLLDCFYPFRIMQLLSFLHECLSFASLSAVPHDSSIFFKSPSKIFSGSFLAFPVSFCQEDYILSPSWESFSVPL